MYILTSSCPSSEVICKETKMCADVTVDWRNVNTNALPYISFVAIRGMSVTWNREQGCAEAACAGVEEREINTGCRVYPATSSWWGELLCTSGREDTACWEEGWILRGGWASPTEASLGEIAVWWKWRGILGQFHFQLTLASVIIH